MFAVVRIASIRILAIVLAVLVLAVPLGVVAQQYARANPICIGIDPGHGGYDGGVTGLKTGVKECDVNLSVAGYLATYLRGAGYRVVQTRTKDVAPVEVGSILADDSVQTGARKVRDMNLRLATLRNAACDLAISIHCNFYPSGYRRGIQVFYGKDADLPLAQCLQNDLNATLNMPQIGREYQPLWGDLYLPANAHCPTAIVECGFLSNAEDEALLVQDSYRMILAYQLFCAIQSYLGQDVLNV